MLSALLIAAVLVAVTVAVRAAGFALVLRSFMKSHNTPPTQPWPIAWLLIRVTWLLILMPVVESETTYDWGNDQWTVPFNLAVAQLVKIGKVPVQFEVGGRYYAEHADHGPEWGMRFGVTFLFPK